MVEIVDGVDLMEAHRKPSASDVSERRGMPRQNLIYRQQNER